MTDLQQKIEEARKKAEQKKQAAAAAIENLKKLEARQKENDRKARTKRFIDMGEKMESVFGSPEAAEYAFKISSVIQDVLGRNFAERDPDLLLDFLKKQEANGQFFTNAMSK